MILIICIGVYIIIGVLMNFFHPEIPELNSVLRSVYRPTINDYIANGRYIPWWKRISAILLIRIVIVVIGPGASLIDLIIYTIRKYKKEDEDYSYLYFSLVKGAGEVSCVICGYQSKLTGYIDAGPGSSWYQKGYQCQSCGSFHQIEFADKREQLPRCECGGAISRNEYVFCPECRSDHLIYYEQYVSEAPSESEIY